MLTYAYVMSQQSHESDVNESVVPAVDAIDVTDGKEPPVDSAVQAESEGARYRHPFLVYSALRLGLLLVAGAICYLLGARGILLILLAFLISAIASFILLVSPRDEVGRRTGAYFRRLNQRIEDSKTAEDDLVDQAAEGELRKDSPKPPA